MGAVGGGFALQGIEIPHRVDRHLGGQIGRVGVPAPRRHDGMDLDQLTAPVQFHRVRISAGLDALPDQFAGHAVERFGDLHMPIRGHLRMAPARNVEHLLGHRFQCG